MWTQRYIFYGKTEGAFRYVRTNIEQQGDRIVMNQDHYIDSIELIDLSRFAGMSNDDTLDESGQALFRSKVGALNWLAVQTRQDIAYEVINETKYILNSLSFV